MPASDEAPLAAKAVPSASSQVVALGATCAGEAGVAGRSAGTRGS